MAWATSADRGRQAAAPRAGLWRSVAGWRVGFAGWRVGLVGWRVGLAGTALCVAASAAAAADVPNVMYRCPGNDYNNTLSPKEAKDRGCKTLEGAPITIIQSTKPRPVPAAAANGSGSTAGAASARVDPADQRARDSDARRILEAELQREQERLAQMKAEYNNGEPDRLGSEKNYQRYLDRVADMKTAIARKETDIAAIKRELQKLPS